MSKTALKCQGCGMALKPKPVNLKQVWVNRNGERYRLISVVCECGADTYVQLDNEETLEQLSKLEGMAQHAVSSGVKKSKEFNIARRKLEEMRRVLTLEHNNELFSYDDGRTFILRLAMMR